MNPKQKPSTTFFFFFQLVHPKFQKDGEQLCCNNARSASSGWEQVAERGERSKSETKHWPAGAQKSRPIPHAWWVWGLQERGCWLSWSSSQAGGLGYSYFRQWQPDFPQKLIKTRSYSTFSGILWPTFEKGNQESVCGPSGPAVGFGQFILGQSHVVHVISLAYKSESIKATTFSSGGSKL